MFVVGQKFWGIFCFLGWLLMLAGCTYHDIEEPPGAVIDSEFIDPIKGLPDEGPISFQEPKVGQRNAYVFFEAAYTRSTGNVYLQYYTDTLVIAIAGKESSNWIVKEFLTKSSNSRLHPENSFWGTLADSVFLSELEVDENSVHIFRQGGYRPAITFSFLAEQEFPLSLVPDNFPENPVGLPFFGSGGGRWLEYVKNFVRIDKTYSKLNIFFDYRWIEVDGPGFMCVYGPEDGMVRTTWFNPWVPDEVVGWDVIPR
jgi:hypothetical protein